MTTLPHQPQTNTPTPRLPLHPNHRPPLAQKPPTAPVPQHNLPRNRRQPQLDLRMGRRTPRGRLNPRPLRPNLPWRSPRRHAREPRRRQPIHQTLRLNQQHHHQYHQHHPPRHPLLHRLPLLQPTHPHPLGLLLLAAPRNHRPHARRRRRNRSRDRERQHARQRVLIRPWVRDSVLFYRQFARSPSCCAWCGPFLDDGVESGGYARRGWVCAAAGGDLGGGEGAVGRAGLVVGGCLGGLRVDGGGMC
jgi:hypothetical protein